MPFLRYVLVVGALKMMRNKGLIPTAIKGSEMPNNVAWNNFFEVRTAFHIFYCFLAGYSWTMDVWRAIQLYVFHGHGVPRVTKRGVKRTPLIAVLRKQLVNGRHLFVKNWNVNFVGLRGYFETHPDDVKYLDDGGKAEVPVELLAAMEVGFRQTAKNNTDSFGKYALASKEEWGSPDIDWRKMETYITSSRRVMPSVKKSRRHWKNQTLEGHQLRNRLMKTFRTRHLPLSRSKCVLHRI